MSTPSRNRRRARRIADVEYDRTADSPTDTQRGDGERVVELDDAHEDQLDGIDFYLNERPPHHG